MLKLRRTEPGDPLIVSMAGLRLGDAVLFFGCDNPRSIALLASKPGLTGRAAAVDPDPAKVTAAIAVAEAEGALLEGEAAPVGSLPYAADTFDVVIAIRLFSRLAAAERVIAFSQAHRVTRPGGRCVAIEGGGTRGIAGLFGASTAPADQVERVLQEAGFRGVRTLAERERLLFIEGARAK